MKSVIDIQVNVHLQKQNKQCVCNFQFAVEGYSSRKNGGFYNGKKTYEKGGCDFRLLSDGTDIDYDGGGTTSTSVHVSTGCEKWQLESIYS
jgi:hypothetical protein